MATGLDVAAGIAGLITLADVVIDRTYRTIKACKHACEESRRLLSDTQALLGVLNGLLKLAEQVNQTNLTSHITPETVHDCQQTLMRVRDKLVKAIPDAAGNSKITKLSRTLRWPFTSQETQEILDQMQRYKMQFDLSVSMDVLEALLNGEAEANRRLAEVAKSVKDLVRIAIDRDRLSILKFFHTFEPEKNHETNVRLRQAGTGFWLTRGTVFNHWKTEKNSKLWIHGIPGAGKTVLTAAVIEEVAGVSSDTYALAYFYCDYKSENTLQLRNLLASIAGQLARQNEDCFKSLDSLHRRSADQSDSHPLPQIDDLVRLIRSMVSDFDDVAIIIDGVDECHDAAEVAFCLAELSMYCPEVRIILTSRREQSIEQHMAKFTFVSIAAQSDDLKLYVSSQLTERIRKGSLRLKSSALKDEILDKLVHGAEGMFRWVACQIDALCRLPTDAARRKALNNLPADLYTTYDRILERIEQNGKDSSTLAQRVLRWLFNHRPYIEPLQLYEALSIGEATTWLDADAIPDQADVLNLCGSLVRARPDTSELEYAHFTVKEYLSSEHIRNSSKFGAYFCSDQLVYQFKADTCLRYLTMPEFSRMSYPKWQDLVHLNASKPLHIFACENLGRLSRIAPGDSTSAVLLFKLFTDTHLEANLRTWKLSFLFDSHLRCNRRRITSDVHKLLGLADRALDDEGGQLTDTHTPSTMDESPSESSDTDYSSDTDCSSDKDCDQLVGPCHDGHQYLQSLWARVNAIADNSSPIHYAAMLHLTTLVKHLASRGAAVDFEGALGIPFECALWSHPAWHTSSESERNDPEFARDNKLMMWSARGSEYCDTLYALAHLGSLPFTKWSDEQSAMMMDQGIRAEVGGFLLTLMTRLPGQVIQSLLHNFSAGFRPRITLKDLRAKSVDACDARLFDVLVAQIASYMRAGGGISTIAHFDVDSDAVYDMVRGAIRDDNIGSLKILIETLKLDSCDSGAPTGVPMHCLAAELAAPKVMQLLLHNHNSSRCTQWHGSNYFGTPEGPRDSPSHIEIQDRFDGNVFNAYLEIWAQSTTEHADNDRHSQFLRLLLKYGASISLVTNESGHTVLTAAISSRVLTKLEALRLHISPSDLGALTGIPHVDRGLSRFPLELAADLIFPEAFRMILDLCPELKQTKSIFRRIIRAKPRTDVYCFHEGLVQMLETAVAYKADIVCKNASGTDSLYELVAQLPAHSIYSAGKIISYLSKVFDLIRLNDAPHPDVHSMGETGLFELCRLIAIHPCDRDDGQTWCAHCEVLEKCLDGCLSILGKTAVVHRRQAGASPLDMLFRGACRNGRRGSCEVWVKTSCFRALLQVARYADVDSLLSLRRKTWSVLGISLLVHEYELAEKLLGLGADVDSVDDYGWGPCSPLQLVVGGGSSSAVIKLALSKAKSINVRDARGFTLLHQMCRMHGPQSMAQTAQNIQWLTAGGVNINDDQNDERWTPLAMAAFGGEHFLVEQFILAGADVRHISEQWTALALACIQGQGEVVKCLLGKGAGLDFVIRPSSHVLWRMIGATPFEIKCALGPLHLAVISRNIETVNLLLDHESAVQLSGAEGEEPWPIWWACYLGDPLIVKLLLQHHPDIATSDAQQMMSPLHIAAANGHAEVVEILLDHGCNPLARVIE